MAKQAKILVLLLLCLCRAASAQQLVCKWVGASAGSDAWCNANCNHIPPFCPKEDCTCLSVEAPTTLAPTTTEARPSTITLTRRRVSLRSTTRQIATTSTSAAAESVMGFWYGYAPSPSIEPAPSSGWYFSYPGQLQSPPFVAGWGTLPPVPSWGSYDKKILTQGGGDTSWGNDLYTLMLSGLALYAPIGWDGVCWAWDTVGADHSARGFNTLMHATKMAGLLNIVTTPADGPRWAASNHDATEIDWSAVDYLVPQLFDGSGARLSEWETFAEYWLSGPLEANRNGVTFAAIPQEKILWGLPAGMCDIAAELGGAGCVERLYSPNVQPQP